MVVWWPYSHTLEKLLKLGFSNPIVQRARADGRCQESIADFQIPTDFETKANIEIVIGETVVNNNIIAELSTKIIFGCWIEKVSCPKFVDNSTWMDTCIWRMLFTLHVVHAH